MSGSLRAFGWHDESPARSVLCRFRSRRESAPSHRCRPPPLRPASTLEQSLALADNFVRAKQRFDLFAQILRFHGQRANFLFGLEPLVNVSKNQPCRKVRAQCRNETALPPLETANRSSVVASNPPEIHSERCPSERESRSIIKRASFSRESADRNWVNVRPTIAAVPQPITFSAAGFICVIVKC